MMARPHSMWHRILSGREGVARARRSSEHSAHLKRATVDGTDEDPGDLMHAAPAAFAVRRSIILRT